MGPRSFLRASAALAAGVALALGVAGCAASGAGARPDGLTHDARVGFASFYAGEHHGHRTASGERFDMNAMTAAHRSLPFGTRVRVTNLDNGRDIVVRINDRGPFDRQRIIDVSYGAARRLRMVGRGVARVRLEVL